MPKGAHHSLNEVDRLNNLSCEVFEREFVQQHLSNNTVPGKGFRISFHTSQTLQKHDLEQCLALIQTTSSEAYRNSARGWSVRSKRAEMKQRDMKYLLLFEDADMRKTTSKSILGFLSFMVTVEDDLDVVWCYELHLVEAIRRRGLGKVLIAIMEDVTKAIRFKYMMLTVFESNQRAVDFYKANGWVVQGEEPPPERKKLRNPLAQKSPTESIATMLKIIT